MQTLEMVGGVYLLVGIGHGFFHLADCDGCKRALSSFIGSTIHLILETGKNVLGWPFVLMQDLGSYFGRREFVMAQPVSLQREDGETQEQFQARVGRMMEDQARQAMARLNREDQ